MSRSVLLTPSQTLADPTLFLNSVEKKEAALKKMMATVTKDKRKIEGTIAELDRYKRDALKTTWTKVNG